MNPTLVSTFLLALVGCSDLSTTRVEQPLEGPLSANPSTIGPPDARTLISNDGADGVHVESIDVDPLCSVEMQPCVAPGESSKLVLSCREPRTFDLRIAYTTEARERYELSIPVLR